jgi:hypothetical protein
VQAVVIVPTFDRPEMLFHCLDHLARSAGGRSVPVRVHVDMRAGNAYDDVIDVIEAHPEFGVTSLGVWSSVEHDYPGNSFNLLSAYRRAYEWGAQAVYLVEDDVMVTRDFFVWHEHVHAAKQPAASMGVSDPGHGAYASLGVCLTRDTVAAVLKHAVPAYFRDMRGYCARTFPPSPFDCEQDGLIARVLSGRTVAWADPPVVSHVGWYGYHRRKTARPVGTLDERIRQVREQIEAGLPGTAPDVRLAAVGNTGTYTLSTVPGAAA